MESQGHRHQGRQRGPSAGPLGCRRRSIGDESVCVCGGGGGLCVLIYVGTRVHTRPVYILGAQYVYWFLQITVCILVKSCTSNPRNIYTGFLVNQYVYWSPRVCPVCILVFKKYNIYTGHLLNVTSIHTGHMLDRYVYWSRI